ncbi:YbhB/YbcL family Raf kinase inhibitor-like protein [Fructobacillus fructosus]|uniref:YbhB/YbcL family Raf kinase inhibitor-like protein n=1 Tax=Fructobacillus fructosus TaxID=1631 RepID=UPI002D9D864B|nr:Uncharacterized conserved protein [Fructobacillus fructosus]CAK1231205.1 Uncharacterized conserved protein [Fructobacillus fructosus]CAK1233542.1 Uncharacterized conserved protein [Fructobacillus fructosus]
MKIQTPFQGALPDKYGKQAPENFRIEGIPACSFPFELADLPNGTKDLAITFIDYDAVPVTGFPFIHWIATGFGPVTVVPEDISQTSQTLLQGQNSFGSKFYPDYGKDIVEHYGGPMPPNKDHDYTLTVFALDRPLELANGFYLNDLLRAMNGHVLDQAQIQVLAKA